MRRKALLLLLTVMAALVVLGGTALAATYTGSKVGFVLNKSNLVSTVATKLYSKAIGPALTVGTHSEDPNATPLSLDTKTSSQAPMKVDSETKVDNLNADQLDGLDSDGFVQGKGVTIADAIDIPGGSPPQVVMFHDPVGLVSPEIAVRYFCPASLTHPGEWQLYNLGDETINVFEDNGGEISTGENPTYVTLSKDEHRTLTAPPHEQHVTWQVQGAGIATIEAFSVRRPTFDCHVQAQGLFSFEQQP